MNEPTDAELYQIYIDTMSDHREDQINKWGYTAKPDTAGIAGIRAVITAIEPLIQQKARDELVAELLDSGSDLPSVCFRHPMFRTRKESDHV